MPDDQKIAEAVAHSRFKIEWAKNHINGVKQLVDASIANNSYPIVVEADLHSGLVRIGPKQGIPVGLPLHLGDAIHALNSAIDFLWSGLARAIDPSLENGRITFPRHKTREQLEISIDLAIAKPTKGNDGAVHVAFPKAKVFILDDVKPYKGLDGPSFIWHLGKVENINKHRMLITTPYAISFKRGIVIQGADGGTFTQAPDVAVQTQGHPLTISLTPPVEVKNDPEPTVNIVFGETEHFTGEPVVETLVNLVEATTEVVNLFERTFVS